MLWLFKWHSEDLLSQLFGRKNFVKISELWYLFGVSINKSSISGSVCTDIDDLLDGFAAEFHHSIGKAEWQPCSFLISLDF